MKTIIRTLSVLLFTSFAFMASAQTSKAITITPQTTKVQIDTLVAALKKQNITLTIQTLKFTDKGLTEIKGKVSKKGIQSLSFSTDDLHSLALYLTKDKWGVEVK